MFGIDNMDVVDATMAGNEARFINHSCEPNCYSRIITIEGKKKIMIFAKRRLVVSISSRTVSTGQGVHIYIFIT